MWKNGSAPLIYTFELGQHGRFRSNAWDYAGVSTPKFDRLEELAMLPTVKPIALVSNTVKDRSRRNGLVLDPFVGSGTVLIKMERIGRKAHALGTDQSYVEVAIKRCRHSVERENHRMASQRASSWN